MNQYGEEEEGDEDPGDFDSRLDRHN